MQSDVWRGDGASKTPNTSRRRNETLRADSSRHQIPQFTKGPGLLGSICRGRVWQCCEGRLPYRNISSMLQTLLRDSFNHLALGMGREYCASDLVWNDLGGDGLC